MNYVHYYRAVEMVKYAQVYKASRLIIYLNCYDLALVSFDELLMSISF